MSRARFQALRQTLRLPLIAAPMFLVSGPDLVAEACSAGVVGSFPTANCRTPEELDQWLRQIDERTTAKEQLAVGLQQMAQMSPVSRQQAGPTEAELHRLNQLAGECKSPEQK